MAKNIGRATINYMKDISEVLSWSTASIIRYNKDIGIAKKWLTPTVSIWKWKIKIDFLFKNFKMDNWWMSPITKVENIECNYKINNDFYGYDILDFKPIKDRLLTSNQKTYENAVPWRWETKDSIIIAIPIDDLVLWVKPTLTEEVKKLANKQAVEKAWETYHQEKKGSGSKEQFYKIYIEYWQVLKSYSEKIAFTIAMLKLRWINSFWVELKILTSSSNITREFN